MNSIILNIKIKNQHKRDMNDIKNSRKKELIKLRKMREKFIKIF